MEQTKRKQCREVKALEMNSIAKMVFYMVLLLSIAYGCISLTNPTQAYAKTVAKVTKKFTLTPKKDLVIHKLSITGGERVFVKVKFLDVKGKVSKDATLFFGWFEGGFGMDRFFSDENKQQALKRDSFKKGKVLDSYKNGEFGYIGGDADVEWRILKGLKKLKVKVTYYTQSGNAGIESIKQGRSYEDIYPGMGFAG